MGIRWARCAVALVAAVVAVPVASAWSAEEPAPAIAAPAARVQSTAPTSTPGAGSSGTPATSSDLLEGTTTTAPVTVTTQAKRSASTRVADDNRRVWLVVAGLVAVAILLALLTIWYWARTRPSRVAAAVGVPSSSPGAGPRRPVHPALARDRPAGRPPAGVPAGGGVATVSKRTTAGGLDHVRADADYAPRGRRRSARAEPPGPRRPVRPPAAQREAALRRAREPRS